MMTRHLRGVRNGAPFGAVGLACMLALAPALPAFALSDLKSVPREDDGGNGQTPDTQAPAMPNGLGLPKPSPLIANPTPAPDAPADNADAPPVEVLRDIANAPEPVRRLYKLITEAAASGDIQRLRPLLETGPEPTQIMNGEDPDSITVLKGLSGDEDGDEVLAIMLDILSTGFVRVGAGTPEEVYVWPYFAEKPINSLTPPEKVDLLRIVTAGDYQDMLEYGNYSFFRLGITPDGKWKFLTAGD